MLRIMLMALFTCLCACHQSKGISTTETKNFEASLMGRADPNFFLGLWECYPTLEMSLKAEKTWTDFQLNKDGELVVTLGKKFRDTGELSISPPRDHEATLAWLNENVAVIDDFSFNWTLHDWTFVRATPRVPSHSIEDLRLIDLQKELKRIIHNLITAMGGIDEQSLVEIETTLKSWEGKPLTQDQLVKIEMVEDYLKYAPLAESILRDDLVGLEKEIFIAKTKKMFEQLTEVVKTGARCGLSVTDYGDFYSLLYGKDLCTGEALNTMGRVISAIAIIGGNSGALRKLADGVGISSKAVGKEIVEVGERVIDSAKNVAHVRWGTWTDLPRITKNGVEYAQIGGRRYTRHAVDRMTPTGFGTAAGGSAGRGVPTMVVEATIKIGDKVKTQVMANGAVRETWLMGTVEVVTENAKELVITVMRKGG